MFPLPLRIIGRIAWNIPGMARSPDQYAPIAAYTISIAAAGKDDLCWDEYAKVLPLCTSANEEKVRTDLWQAMMKLLEEHK